MLSKLALSKFHYTRRLIETQAALFSSKNATPNEESSNFNENSNFEPKKEGRNIDADPENITFSHIFSVLMSKFSIKIGKKPEINVLRIIWRVFVWSCWGLFFYNFYLLKTSENPFKELGYVDPFFRAAKWTNTKYTNFYDFMTKPPLEKLLPDFPQIPGMNYDPPKTLVLNLSGTLIHTNYVMGKGAEIMKRPGLKTFVDKLSQLYEIVIFSDDDSMFTFSIGEKIDPKRMFLAGCFGRESTLFENGAYIKDLRYLNRDLKKVIAIETNPEKIKYQKENGVFLKEFNGDKDDKALFELIPFLEYLSRPDVRDVRAELKKYGQEEPGKKFLEELKAKQKSLSEKQNKGLAGIFHGMAQNKSQPQYFQKKI